MHESDHLKHIHINHRRMDQILKVKSNNIIIQKL